jgi:signal transduction histidine kinase
MLTSEPGLNLWAEASPILNWNYQSKLLEVVRDLAQINHLNELTEYISHALPPALDLAWAALLLNDNRGQLKLNGEEDTAFRLHLTKPLYHLCTTYRRPFDPSQLAGYTNQPSLAFLRTQQVQSCVPLLLQNRLLGLLLIGLSASDWLMGPQGQNLLELLGWQLSQQVNNLQFSTHEYLQLAHQDRRGLLIHNQKLLQAREEERKHISRELHDDVVQDLLLLNNQLELLQQENPALSETLEPVCERTGQVLNTVRRICGNLRPRLLDVSLSFSLSELARRFREDHARLNLTFYIEGREFATTEQIRLVIYRTAQEALNNVYKHSQAQQASLKLRFKPATGDQVAQIELIVKDNGQGFVPPANVHELFKQDHLGLLGMYERVYSESGELHIISIPDRGTTIMVTIPVNKTTAQHQQ